MSTKNLEEQAADMMMCCASCGTAQVDDIKLKKCTACKSVRYCSIACQREHRPQHKRACEKRAAELHDEILFRQPESSYLGDCPICCLPMSLDQEKSIMMTCCSKIICDGCVHSYELRIFQAKLGRTCPFCRQPAPKSEEEEIKNVMKRVKANDPVAMVQMSLRRKEAGDYDTAFRYLSKAAELGDAGAHFELSIFYEGQCCVEKDVKKELYHLEQAAIGGDAIARYNLGCEEKKNGRMDRAIKHWIIAATLGCDDSLNSLKDGYEDGLLSKEDFAAVLRAHQAAVEATKSPQREAAEEAQKK